MTQQQQIENLQQALAALVQAVQTYTNAQTEDWPELKQALEALSVE
jgi:hypothetical protein